jgi:putative ABC transport system permease protein
MIRQNLAAALDSLRLNPLRSYLTTSGIVVGIAAVVIIVSIGKGHKVKIEAEIERLGSDLLWVEVARLPFQSGMQSASARIFPATSVQRSLRVEDAEAVALTCTKIQSSAPIINSFATGSFLGQQTQFSLIATTPEYQKVRSVSLLWGRFLTDMDEKNINNICAIEEAPGFNPYVQKLNSLWIQGRRFQIVGVVKRQEASTIPGTPLRLYIPLSVAQRRLTGSRSIHTIYCLAKDGDVDGAREQLETVLKSVSQGKLNFQIRTALDLFEHQESLTQTATLVSAGIGMLSLFVGGLGIMNILLASVFERTREIGIRKATGARKKDILFQFLFESVALCVVGGIIGVGLGFIGGKVLNLALGIPEQFSPEAVVLGLSFSSFVGIAFGLFPAVKAAKLSPVDALRYE